MKVRFTKLTCKTSNKTTTVQRCEIKAYSKTHYTPILNLTLLRQLNSAFVNYFILNSLILKYFKTFPQADFRLQYKSVVNYRTIVNMNKLSACDYIGTVPKNNMVQENVRRILNSLTTISETNFIHDRPFSHDFLTFANYTGNPKLGTFQFKGDFIATLKIYDDIDPQIATIDLYYNIQLKTYKNPFF